MEDGLAFAPGQHEAMHVPVAGRVAEPHLALEQEAHVMGGPREAARRLLPQLLHSHSAPQPLLGAAHLGDGLEADHLEGIRVPGDAAHGVRHPPEVVPGHGHGGGRHQGAPRLPPRVADDGRELLAQGVQLLLAGRVLVALAPAHGGIHVDADLAQAALLHEPLQEPGPAPERVAMGHEHGHQAQPVGVEEQLPELLLGPERHLAVRELQVPAVAEEGPQRAHLGLDGVHALRGNVVGLLAQVAAAAGEVAPRHGPDGGPAPPAPPLCSEKTPHRVTGWLNLLCA